MSLATWLRAGRDRRKLTIEDVAKITKIQPRILEKLESGQLEGLPAEVFVKGFVRSFAKCVGLDETEALDKYSAAQAAPDRNSHSGDSGSFAIAKALVETMQPREGDARPKDGSRRGTRLDTLGSGRPVDVETVIEAKRVAQGTPVEPAPVVAAAIEAAPSDAAPVIDAAPGIEAAPAIEAAPTNEASVAPVIEAQVVAAAAAIEQPQPTKKKRSRKNSKQRAKQKKQVQQELAAVAAAVAADVAVGDNDAVETNVFEKQSIDTGPVASISASGDGESLEAISIEAKTTEPLSTASEPEPTDGIVDSAPLAEGSNPTIAIAQDGLEIPATALEATSGETTQATWQPTMPPIATPSMPWRRPNLPTQTASRAPVVPSLLIDDADPDSADREREDRIAKEPNRLSFLPPILLDREDRSARQGGLTLAVIILLIAATLTLSYLMRRPSPSGDGVTMLDGTSQLIG